MSNTDMPTMPKTQRRFFPKVDPKYRLLPPVDPETYYPGKKDHHKRVTTERPHPTDGGCPRQGHGKGKLIRILFSVYFGGFRG